MKKLYKTKFLWVGIVLLLGTLTMAIDECGSDMCLIGDGKDDVSSLLGFKPISNAFLENCVDGKMFSFDNKITELKLKQPIIIGEWGKPMSGDARFNVGGHPITVSPDTGFKFDEKYGGCFAVIAVNDVTIENFKFVGFSGAALCIATNVKGTTLNKIDFSEMKKPLWLMGGTEITIKNSTFNKDDTEPIRWHNDVAKTTALITSIDNVPPTNFCNTLTTLGIDKNNKSTCTVTGCPESFVLQNNATCECPSDKSKLDQTTGKCVANVPTCNDGEAYDDAGNCKACAETEEVKDGKCIAKDGGTTGTCTDENATHNADGSCGACIEKYGRYDAGKPCVECGSHANVVNDKCDCHANYHRNLKGQCVADDATDLNKCGDDSNAVVDNTGTCVCKHCFDYTWDVSSTSAIDAGPNCNTALPDCEPTPSCSPGLVANEAGTACVDEPPAASTKGECGCNLNVGESTTAQKVLPYLMIALSGLGLKMWRRKRL